MINGVKRLLEVNETGKLSVGEGSLFPLWALFQNCEICRQCNMGCRLCQNYMVSGWMVNTLTYSLQGDESISSVSSE